MISALAVGGIYRCAGSYRSALFDERENAEQVRIEGLRIGGSDHVPPGAASIRGYVIDMLDVCNAADREPLDRAAYALWRCNWIHPFAGGNGRVARALTYLILCMDMGAMIPGKTTMPRLIAAFRERYLAALQGVDKNTSELGGDAIDVDPALGFLQPMTRFVAAMLYLQLRSAKLTAP